MKYIYDLYYKIIFKFKDPKDVTTHPKYDLHIKYGFSVGNKHYYRLLHDYDIFQNRFAYAKTFYDEVGNKLTSQDINDFAGAAKKYIGDYIKSLHSNKDEVDPKKLDAAISLLDEMEYRGEWLFEPTSLFKYASVFYFDLGEDIKDYDVDYNHDKIKHWSKKKSLLRMLLKELMTGVQDLLNLSSEDFNSYLSALQQKKDKQQKLISDSGLDNNRESVGITI